MKTECGKARVILVLRCAILMLFLGLTTYVIFQDNGIYDREIQPIIENYIEETNNVIANDENTVVKE